MTTLYEMTPREIVAELDKYIIGQDSAKRSVAVALRNRYRRSKLPEAMRDEVTPKNILMMGPTGVGKTEIARRLAKLMDAPFVKVEATKFTEVGYVGRDVDSMIRDLMEASIRVTKQKRLQEKYSIAEEMANEKIIAAIIPGKQKATPASGVRGPFDLLMGGGFNYNQQSNNQPKEEVQDHEVNLAREQVRQQLAQGLLEEQFIEIEIEEAPKSNQLDLQEGTTIAIGSIFGDMMPKKKKKKGLD